MLQEQTNALLMPIQARLPSLDSEPLPEAVYHYTDIGGLLGIVDSGVLWATDYRYLNDSSELRYIFDQSRQVVEDYLQGGQYDLIGQTFLEYALTGRPPYDDTAYYLCCFSEVDNSLSQWRAYGHQQGFSLSFPGDITSHTGALDVPRLQGQTPGITLLKVNYDSQVHTEYVSALIKELLVLCTAEHIRLYSTPQDAISHIAPFYWAQLERASYRFKHPDFADEREWRLVSWVDLKIADSRRLHPEFFRAGASLIPYTTFHVFSGSHGHSRPSQLPLLAVRSGPTMLPNETTNALDRLLTARGYENSFCERRHSETPARPFGH